MLSIEREIREEAGIQAKADRLAVICEIFFKGHGGAIDGLDCHEIELYYTLHITDEQRKQCRTQTDDGEPLVWVNINVLKDCAVKPPFIGERINEMIKSSYPIHIIEERDR